MFYGEGVERCRQFWPKLIFCGFMDVFQWWRGSEGGLAAREVLSTARPTAARYRPTPSNRVHRKCRPGLVPAS